MIQLSEAQILAWITPLLWPFLRALAMLGTLPVFGEMLHDPIATVARIDNVHGDRNLVCACLPIAAYA